MVTFFLVFTGKLSVCFVHVFVPVFLVFVNLRNKSRIGYQDFKKGFMFVKSIKECVFSRWSRCTAEFQTVQCQMSSTDMLVKLLVFEHKLEAVCHLILIFVYSARRPEVGSKVKYL